MTKSEQAWQAIDELVRVALPKALRALRHASSANSLKVLAVITADEATWEPATDSLVDVNGELNEDHDKIADKQSAAMQRFASLLRIGTCLSSEAIDVLVEAIDAVDGQPNDPMTDYAWELVRLDAFSAIARTVAFTEAAQAVQALPADSKVATGHRFCRDDVIANYNPFGDDPALAYAYARDTGDHAAAEHWHGQIVG